MSTRCWEQVIEGETLLPMTFPLTVFRLVLAAGGMRDFNPIHHNSEFARSTGAPDMYANTTFLLGMWERLIRSYIGSGGTICSMKGFRMGSFNTVGDTVTVLATVERKWEQAGVGYAALRIWSESSKGVSVGPGIATVTLARQQQN